MAMNPFTLMFGKEPHLTIPRRNIVSEVYSDFSSPYPTSQIYFLSAHCWERRHCILERALLFM